MNFDPTPQSSNDQPLDNQNPDQPTMAQGPDTDQLMQQGVGTQGTGFVKGKYGPFQCGNCEWFDGVNTCTNPLVQQDQQVDPTQVDEDDCCNHFWTKGLDPAQYLQDQVSGDDQVSAPKPDQRQVLSPHGFPALGNRLDKYLPNKKKRPNSIQDESGQRSGGASDTSSGF